MKASMKTTLIFCFIVSLATALTACMGGGKPRANIAKYDFGVLVKSNQLLQADVDVEEITASDALSYQQMRYRLSYENPAQVFYYTESRWIALPSELLNTQLAGLLKLSNSQNQCSLRLKLQGFDQLFVSKSNSIGLVSLSATLIDKKNTTALSHTFITEQAPASAANAQAGAKALAVASEATLIKAIEWANSQAKQIAICH